MLFVAGSCAGGECCRAHCAGLLRWRTRRGCGHCRRLCRGHRSGGLQRRRDLVARPRPPSLRCRSHRRSSGAIPATKECEECERQEAPIMKLQEVTVPQYTKTCQFCSGNSENHLCITEILCTWGGFTVSSRVVASTSGNSTYLASIFALFYM